MIFVLQNIRSAWNVGSIFRTADAVGAHIVCVGYTPRPIEPVLKLIKKTAIGAEKTVQWQSFETTEECVQALSVDKGYSHWAIEISSISSSLLEYISKNPIHDTEKLCIWFGNEIGGLDDEALSHCEKVLHLPMRGMKESLNVANTVTTVAYLIQYAAMRAE